MALPTVTLNGNLKKTSLTYIPSGKALYKFQLECSEKNSKGEWDNLYVNGELWEKQAEFANNYFKDGASVSVTGKLITHSYEKRDGTKAYEIKLTNCSFAFLPKDRTVNDRNMQEPPVAGGEYIDNNGIRQSTFPEIDIDETKIPF